VRAWRAGAPVSGIAATFPLRARGIAACALSGALIAIGLAGGGEKRYAPAFLAGMALAALVVFLFVSLLASYLAFIARSRARDGGRALRLSTAAAVYSGEAPRVFSGVPAAPAGFLSVASVRMAFADGTLSPGATLTRRSRDGLLLSGQADVPDHLPGGAFDLSSLRSGRYEASRVVLRLEDPLGLFRLTYSEDGGGFAFTVFSPRERSAEALGRPDATETETLSRERARAEGELLEIRKYVPGSDPSRRIVWKLFARTGRLMIRDAEKESVNASRLPLFVSFCSDGRPRFGGDAAEGLLESYKSIALAAMRSLKEAGFHPVYCAERRVSCLEAGDDEGFRAFDRELEPVEPARRDEVEMAAHPWSSAMGVERQLKAWADRLRSMDAPRSRAILVTQGLDAPWAASLAAEGGGGSVYLVRLSREFFTRKDPRSPAERLLRELRDDRPWEIDSPASRVRWGALRDWLARREEEALADAKARSVEVVEL